MREHIASAGFEGRTVDVTEPAHNDPTEGNRSFSFVPSRTEGRPVRTETVPEGFAQILATNIMDNIRTKPSYSDCWSLEPTPDGEVVAGYSTSRCTVNISVCPDGVTEYDAVPVEYAYPDGLNTIMMDIIERLREDYRTNGGSLDRDSVMSSARKILDSMSSEMRDLSESGIDPDLITEDLCSAAYRHSVGAGIFEILLTDPHIEDVYVDAPCDETRIHVTLNGVDGVNSHMRCRTNLMADPREVSNLINILKRGSGLRFCHSSPVLECDFPEFDARATVIGYPMSPNGNAVAIRKHSVRPWTLSRLVANGTVSPRDAGLLSFLIDNRCTMLICGARGAGKSSLLSALLFEFSKEQRLLTIEDTKEIPAEALRGMGYKVQTIIVDDRMDGTETSRADEALRVSLRMGESAIVLGEVRGEEARTLYQSMRAGRAGSSILGTVHGESADSVYKRMVHDIGIPPEAFMATDVIVTLGTVRDRRTGRMIRRIEEMSSTSDSPGEFRSMDTQEGLFSSPVMERALKSGRIGRKDALLEIEARAAMRMILADAGRNDERFLGPEWISVANEIVSHRGSEATVDSLTRILKERMGNAH